MSAPVKGRDEEPFTDAVVWAGWTLGATGADGTRLLPLTVGGVHVG